MPTGIPDQFTSHLRALHRSEKTIRSYASGLKKYCTYLSAARIRSPADASAHHIKRYQAYLMRLYDAPTVISFMSPVRALYRFLIVRGDIISSPTDLVTLPKQPDRLPRAVLTVKEVRALLDATDTGTDKGILYRTVLELAYSTGLRRAELLALGTEDVDAAEGVVRVRQGKGHKDRTVPLGHSACVWVKTYRDGFRNKLLAKGSDPSQKTLFLGVRHGRPLHVDTIAGILKQALRKAGIIKKATFHSLRHAFATHLIQGGADLMDVKEMLGHEQLSTTQRYVDLSITDVRRAHSQFHPREQ